jgi:hypothetical protein
MSCATGIQPSRLPVIPPERDRRSFRVAAFFHQGRARLTPAKQQCRRTPFCGRLLEEPAKGAARTTQPNQEPIAPHSVLRESPQPAKGAPAPPLSAEQQCRRTPFCGPLLEEPAKGAPGTPTFSRVTNAAALRFAGGYLRSPQRVRRHPHFQSSNKCRRTPFCGPLLEEPAKGTPAPLLSAGQRMPPHSVLRPVT